MRTDLQYRGFSPAETGGLPIRVYHCHILDHEDADMMAIIFVALMSTPMGGSASPTHQANAGSGKLKKASAGGAATRA
jgi:hypothetical protein